MKQCKHGGCSNPVRPGKLECRQCTRLKEKYGITVPERDAMLAEQNFECAICFSPIEFTGRHGNLGKHDANTDHCHSNGHVRGILCGPCNVTLGKYEDDPEVFKRMAQYLEDNKL